MSPLVKLGILGVALAGAAACARVQAAAPGPSPLDVPAPPPHVVVPPTPDMTDATDPAPPTTPAPVAQPHSSTTAPTRTPDKPASTSATPTTTTPPEPAVAGAPLETTSDVNALETQTRLLLANANRDLMRIDKQALGSDTRAQYERAVSFVTQAQSALREKNFTYARNMAEKAAVLASQIPKTRT